jgi:hypothetical protein
VLGDVIDKSRAKVERVLPKWLNKPEFVSVDLSDHQMPVDSMPGRWRLIFASDVGCGTFLLSNAILIEKLLSFQIAITCVHTA